jgi:uncharacterized protein (UPF0276 family)
MPIANRITTIPALGVGLGYRSELRQGILANRERIDFLEIITDNYLREPSALAALEELCTLFPVIPHGVDLSIGSVMPLETSYLRGIKRVSDLTKAPYYSEHLCMTRVPGRDIGHLAPLWFTEDLLQHVIRRVLTLQDYLGKPIILENVTYMLEIPHSTMSQTAFFQQLVEATGCGILLDVTNVFINATNHQFDPGAYLRQMPLEHLVQVHLAGGYWRNGWLVDGHSTLVPSEIFDLLITLTHYCQVKNIIFEHDAHFPSMADLLEQMDHARSILQSATNFIMWKDDESWQTAEHFLQQQLSLTVPISREAGETARIMSWSFLACSASSTRLEGETVEGSFLIWLEKRWEPHGKACQMLSARDRQSSLKPHWERFCGRQTRRLPRWKSRQSTDGQPPWPRSAPIRRMGSRRLSTLRMWEIAVSICYARDNPCNG